MPKEQQLGKALQKQQKKMRQDKVSKIVQIGQFVHNVKNQLISFLLFSKSQQAEDAYQIQQRNLQSIIDQDTLNEYLQLAELANQKYIAEKRGLLVREGDRVQDNKQIVVNVNAIRLQGGQTQKFSELQKNQLMLNMRIPRRPLWSSKMSVAELREKENEQFLKWRKDIAKFEEENYTIALTPYEKNIEVWKQLWRVVEKSDIVVQVVDGRDPLFFRCEDLEKYVVEQVLPTYQKHRQCKNNFLLVNKSDLLSEQIRKEWSEYFIKNGVNHIFFSAKQEQERIDKEDEDSVTRAMSIVQIVDQEESKIQNEENYLYTHKIVDRKILLEELKKLVGQIRAERVNDNKEHPQKIEEVQEKDAQGIHQSEFTVIIGMVGYPNVGKSSVINTLCNRKLVGVASRPGKTKHFQTIQLEKELILCDCPGLVFPNAASSRSEMVCNGVLPIDNIKDYLTPIDLLIERIPKLVFEKLYFLNLKERQNIDASYLLSAYSAKRGYVTGRALPDEAKAARIILKDQVNGKLLYCKLPPGVNNQDIWQSNPMKDLEQLIEVAMEEEKQILKEQHEMDEQFNKDLQPKVRITNEDLMEIFSQDDLMQLMEGKRVKGVKLAKPQRREIKFAFQRGSFNKLIIFQGEPIDLKKYLVPQKDQKDQTYLVSIKGKSK